MMNVLLLRFNVVHLRSIGGFCLQSTSRSYSTVVLVSSMPTADVWFGMHDVLLIRISAEYSHGVYVKIPLYSLFVVIAIFSTCIM